MSMRITYDNQIFRLHRHGGIVRYFTELIGAYQRAPYLGVMPRVPARVVASRHLRDAQLGHRVVVPRVLTRAWNLLPAGPRHGQSAQLVHHTYYLPRELTASWHAPRVTTIHDMIPELMPEFFPKGNPHQAKRAYVERSQGLVFVSETSRRDLLRLYGPQDVPMAVAHLAPGRAFHPRHALAGAQGRFVLYVGNRSGYKDFATLLVALAQSSGLSLLAVGGGALSPAEQAQVVGLGLEGRVRQTSVSDEQLAELYSTAVALVVSSRYEGFGLPVVEAMACGCPVVVTDIEVFQEIADEAAEYFRVGDADSLAESLERIDKDQRLRGARREAGILRVEDFTWERTAAATAALYREVLAGSFAAPSFTRSAQGR